ncbi:MAG: hypothetical protein ACRD8U_16180 [Pyrinomonadaceae bacterium]
MKPSLAKTKSVFNKPWMGQARGLTSLVGLRLVQAFLSMLGASILIWALLPLAPGDPALRTLLARGIDNPRPAEIDAMRKELRLDRPAPVQYSTWL